MPNLDSEWQDLVCVPDRIGPTAQLALSGKWSVLFQARFTLELLPERPMQVACTHHQPAQALDLPQHGQHVLVLVSKPDFS